MSGTSSVDEKEEAWRSQDPEVAAGDMKQYEPIVDEEVETAAVDKDIEASNLEKRPSRGPLSRFQTGTSGYSEYSDDASDAKSAVSAKKKWHKKINPLRWGKKPPIPKSRQQSLEYQANAFSRLTWTWMNPIMTVSKI